MNPDSTISAIRPSMIALVSTTIRGSPRDRPAPRSACRRPEDADGLCRDQEVLALGDHQTEHPEAQEDRDAERQQLPQGAARPDSGMPSSRPIRRPRSSPMTAATNSAVDSCLDAGGCSHCAGTTVRYGRIANPTTTQAMTQAAR